MSIRRNLSGIFIFEKFEGEDKRQPTCFEDCTEKTQDEWPDTLDKEALKRLAKQLGQVIVELYTQHNDELDLIIEGTSAISKKLDRINSLMNDR